MTFTDVSDVGRPIVLVPVGSFEQHGPHLPPDTDTVIAVALCREAARRMAGLIVTPPIGIGASGEHAGFTATLSVGTRVLADALVEIGRSADWSRCVVFVNGHGGNSEAIAIARTTLEHEKRAVRFWSPRLPVDGDAHAGRVETSLMLAIDPGSVRTDLMRAGNATPLVDIIDDMRAHGVRGVSANGVLGDPTSSTTEEGRRIFDTWSSDLCGFIGSVP